MITDKQTKKQMIKLNCFTKEQVDEVISFVQDNYSYDNIYIWQPEDKGECKAGSWGAFVDGIDKEENIDDLYGLCDVIEDED